MSASKRHEGGRALKRASEPWKLVSKREIATLVIEEKRRKRQKTSHRLNERPWSASRTSNRVLEERLEALRRASNRVFGHLERASERDIASGGRRERGSVRNRVCQSVGASKTAKRQTLRISKKRKRRNEERKAKTNQIRVSARATAAHVGFASADASATGGCNGLCGA